jgi:hypothetical protein
MTRVVFGTPAIGLAFAAALLAVLLALWMLLPRREGKKNR